MLKKLLFARYLTELLKSINFPSFKITIHININKYKKIYFRIMTKKKKNRNVILLQITNNFIFSVVLLLIIYTIN